MWKNKLKEIIYILENSNVNEIEVNFWGRKYRVSKQSTIVSKSIPSQYNEELVVPVSNQESIKEVTSSDITESAPIGEELLSPMPGTYYSSPTPDDPSFVSVGDQVKIGQTLCIIEAMKIMNEIESESDGIVVDIKVKNGEPVEYNQPLFIINPRK